MRVTAAIATTFALAVLLNVLWVGGPEAPAAARHPAPALGKSVMVAPVSGRVLVKLKRSTTFTTLRTRQVIPVGSTIDAGLGKVRLVTATIKPGMFQSGDFSQGAFTVTQHRSALTDLALTGGRPRQTVCASASASPRGGLPPRVLRLLHADAHGHFRTLGRYSAASVRGTTWTTEDRCTGTLISSSKGVVTTTTGGLSQDLDPGESLLAFCQPPSAHLVLRDYCLFVLSRPALAAFGFGFSTFRKISSYELCIRGPSGTDHCHQFNLRPPNSKGVRISAVGCDQPEGPGSYSARWLVGGRQLGPTLDFTATIAQPTSTPSCLG